MKHAENFAVLFWLRKNAKTNSGKIPLYCKITYDQQRAVFSTGIQLLESQFNPDFQLVKGSSREIKLINDKLNQTRILITDCFNQLTRQQDRITAEIIKKTYLGCGHTSKTVIKAFEWHNQQFGQKVSAGNKAAGTLKKFETSKGKLQAFIKAEFNLNDLPLETIKPGFAEDYEHFLSVNEKLAHNTVMKHIKILKKLLNMAVHKDWISKNPIATFRCTYHQPQRSILLPEELNHLVNKPMPVKRLEEVRDCFVFMCYTGFAFQDAASLTRDDIQLKIDGKRWLVKQRTKTGTNESRPYFADTGGID